jgi:hypothetical protein
MTRTIHEALSGLDTADLLKLRDAIDYFRTIVPDLDTLYPFNEGFEAELRLELEGRAWDWSEEDHFCEENPAHEDLFGSHRVE